MKDPRLPSETSIRDFVIAVGSGEDTHGAVSAAALAGALGSALLMMVAALPKTRSDSIDDRTILVAASAALCDVQEQLVETIETETAVKIFVARNMPQASDAQRSERQAAIQFALRAAADVPLEVMRLCARGLKYAESVAGRGSRAASPEVQLAVALLHTSFSGARSNLEAKLGSLHDAVSIKSVVDEIAHLSDEATARAHAAQSLSQTPPA